MEVIYVAGSDRAGLENFTIAAAAFSNSTYEEANATNSNFNIETAFTLLSSPSPLLTQPIQNTPTKSTKSPALLEEPQRTPLKNYEHEFSTLESLDTNQLLLLDYIILTHATLFAGYWESSFSWGVAGMRSIFHSHPIDNSTEKQKGMWLGINGGSGGKSRGGKVVIEKIPSYSEEVEKEKEVQGEGEAEKGNGTGEVAWRDEKSVVFGPAAADRASDKRREIERIRGCLWP